MKTFYQWFLHLLLLGIAFGQEPGDRVVILPIEKPKEVPLFFSTRAEVTARAGLQEVTSEQRLVFKVHQGRPEVLTSGLSGAGEVVSVTGEGLRDWSVRVAEDGKRFLDIRPVMEEGKVPVELVVQVKTRLELGNGKATVLLAGPGASTGFSIAVDLKADPGVDLKVVDAGGLVPLEEGSGKKFVGSGEASLALAIAPAGSGSRGLELLDAAVSGRLSEDGKSVSFRLTGRAVAEAGGSAVELFGGGAALSSGVSGEGWHVVLRGVKSNYVYDLVADRAGEFPVALEFDVPVLRKGDWHTLDFRLPAGVVVPVRIEGPGEGVAFDRNLAVVPERDGTAWRGFLPANGNASMAWKPADAVADGALFFSSTETTDVRVGSGLLRQSTLVDLRVLQGKLAELSFAMSGPGEVLSVSGAAVLGWSVREENGARRLEVRLSQPIEGSGRISVEAQSALGGFPVRAEALRLAPLGALRHSGWLRVANEGSVRIGVTDATGLIQLAPGQFPGGADEGLRQVFVYRFPAADYGYAIQADQVLPEVGVTEVTVYELAETGRRVISEIELDIREAPLREWEIEIPADHAVASVTGAAVADYSVTGEVRDGMRRLKILFKEAVGNRQLIGVRLEKNQAAKAGAWELSPLGFPGAKSRRGYIGAVAAAGYRLVAGQTTGVAEVPVTFFPRKTVGLQQAFRMRESTWKVGLSVEALGQSVQADVFHLYSLKAGAAYGSVLINYFVVGAPATEWKISVPEAIGNIDVSGQNVGRDWRREGNTVVVPLSRPVLGTGTVLLTFEQPMSARGGELTPGEVRPLGVQGERGYIQVVSPLQVNHEISKSEGALLVIDSSELPAEFRLLSSAPTLAAWQYTARDFSLGMKVEWFEPGHTVEQVVDFFKLTSRVSRDGQWVTDGRLFVKSRGRAALRMGLPKGSSLWEARVDGEAVNAREDGAEILVPLPSRTDPNQAVEIALRYGANAPDADQPTLAAPILAAPVVIGEWTVSGDEGRQLVPRGGSAELVRPVLAESGWEWIARHGGMVAALVALGIASLVMGKREILAGVCGLLVILVAIGLAFLSASTARENVAVLEYAAPVVAAGVEVTVELGNVAPWRAATGWTAWLALLVGVAVSARGFLVNDRLWKVAGLALIGAGVLSFRGGAPGFFILIAWVMSASWLPRIYQSARGLRRPRVAEAVAVLALFGFCGMEARAAELPAESITHDWRIHEGRLHGTMDIAVRGTTGDRFLLLRAPAVLGGFEGSGLRVVKASLDGTDAYFVVAEADGRSSGKAVFEMPLTDLTKGWDLPGGPAAMRRVTLRWDQAGWEFFSPEAARIGPAVGLAESESGATMVFGPENPVKIQARPKQRDVAAEETRFFAEVSNLFLPGPGVVNGRHGIAIRPAQGRVSALVMKVPAGFTVSDVVDGPIGSWRFDPNSGELRVAVEPAQDSAFGFTVETQRGAGALPVDLEIEPLRILSAAGEVGILALAFGDDTQPESVDVEGLSRVNPEDFDASLVPGKLPVQHAFRYGAAVANARVRVAAVAPEIRAESRQLVSLGEDRLVVATDLSVTIARSGVFRLAVEIPDGLEIESATGESLSHWTEGRTNNIRVLILHLAGKTLGKCDFSLTLAGPPPGAQAGWTVPRLVLRDASRETGLLTVVPERGLQVRSVDRRNISQLDPRELSGDGGESAKAAARPGALAYRLLQADWSLSLAISRLDPWVTAKVFHETTLREGQLMTRVAIGYRIENAALKALRVRIPGLDATAAATVRATGPAVADLVPVEPGLWEIRFQRGVAGDTRVELEYQRRGAEAGNETIEPVVLEQARQITYFAVVRAGGRLELEAGTLPRGWQRADWAVVQSTLGNTAGGAAPLLGFRVADPEGPLPVILKRHKLAELRKLRVAEGTLTTLLSPKGDALTAVDLKLHVTGKDTLKLKLPKDAALFNVLVNDEGATLVREGEGWLFHVFPSPDAGQPATVRFVYSAATGKGKRLEGPVLNLPMENLTWRVLVPEGWRMADHGGDFDLKEETAGGTFRLEDYQSFVREKRSKDSQGAAALLDRANSWLSQGDQEKASQALSNAVRSNLLDEASNEDARVQLRQLKTEQAVLGLNTRRQKLAIDNKSTTPQADNAQLERAADANPVLRGDSNYDPKQFDRFLEGNTAEENTALKEIANRIVNQQLAAEPAPVALDVTLSERGKVLVFGRSVQVDGDRPMAITLDLKRAGGGFGWLGTVLCFVLGALGTTLKKK